MNNEDESCMVSLSFEMTDEFGQNTHMCKNVDMNMYDSKFIAVVEMFRCFMLASGFDPEVVDTMFVMDEDDLREMNEELPENQKET